MKMNEMNIFKTDFFFKLFMICLIRIKKVEGEFSMATINLNKKPQTLAPHEIFNLNKRISGQFTSKRRSELLKANKKIKNIPSLRLFK